MNATTHRKLYRSHAVSQDSLTAPIFTRTDDAGGMPTYHGGGASLYQKPVGTCDAWLGRREVKTL